MPGELKIVDSQPLPSEDLKVVSSEPLPVPMSERESFIRSLPPGITMNEARARVMGHDVAHGAGTFLGDLWGGAKGILRIANPMTAPGALQDMFQGSSDAVGRAKEALGANHYTDAAINGVGALPLIGPVAAPILQSAHEGDWPGMLGHIGAVGAAPELMERGIEAVPGAIKTAQTTGKVVKGAKAGIQAELPAIKDWGKAGSVANPIINAILGHDVSLADAFREGGTGYAMGAGARAIPAAVRGGLEAYRQSKLPPPMPDIDYSSIPGIGTRMNPLPQPEPPIHGPRVPSWYNAPPITPQELPDLSELPKPTKLPSGRVPGPAGPKPPTPERIPIWARTQPPLDTSTLPPITVTGAPKPVVTPQETPMATQPIPPVQAGPHPDLSHWSNQPQYSGLGLPREYVDFVDAHKGANPAVIVAKDKPIADYLNSRGWTADRFQKAPMEQKINLEELARPGIKSSWRRGGQPTTDSINRLLLLLK